MYFDCHAFNARDYVNIRFTNFLFITLVFLTSSPKYMNYSTKIHASTTNIVLSRIIIRALLKN